MRRERKERGKREREKIKIMIDLVGFEHELAMLSLLESRERRERMRIICCLRIEAVCAEL